MKADRAVRHWMTTSPVLFLSNIRKQENIVQGGHFEGSLSVRDRGQSADMLSHRARNRGLGTEPQERAAMTEPLGGYKTLPVP